MTVEIPAYALRAYALFYYKYGSKKEFTQSVLDWITGTSMKKKIFAVLLRAGWIKKRTKNTYICVNPATALRALLEFKVIGIIKKSTKKYAFTGLSAIEIWSDYSYVQRGIEQSPYFIKVFKEDLQYWKNFFNTYSVPNYINKGSTINEFVILIPVKNISSVIKDGIYVEPLNKTMGYAKDNKMTKYAYNYMRKKYGSAAT
jgi:hypothetical protein